MIAELAGCNYLHVIMKPRSPSQWSPASTAPGTAIGFAAEATTGPASMSNTGSVGPDRDSSYSHSIVAGGLDEMS